MSGTLRERLRGAGTRLQGARTKLLGRYAGSSVISGVISEGVFLASFGLGALPSVASVIAFVAGAVPNYLMNRYWAWQQNDRIRAGRELLPYIVIIVVTALLASVITTAADAWLHDRVSSQFWQVVLVGIAFLGTYGVMFVIKFFLFDRFIFTGSRPGRTPATRSRS